MTEHHCCSCGFAAPAAAELTDHLHEVFSVRDDTAPDGRQHAEALHGQAEALPRCLCGYEATDLGDLDQHILSAYTPPNAIGPDGTQHMPAWVSDDAAHARMGL